MIAVLKHNTTDEQLKNLTDWLAIQGLGTHISRGNYQTVVGLIGDTSRVDIELLESLEMVESVQRVTDPTKNTPAAFNPAERELAVGVVGLGLIGGSMASTYRLAGWTVLGADRDKTTLGYAKLANIITDELTAERKCGKNQQKDTCNRPLRHQKECLRGRLPESRRTRICVCRRTSHGRHAVFGYQIQPLQPVQGCTDGARSPRDG